MIVKQEGNNLVITIPMGQPTPSATGRTLVVASSKGNKPSGVKLPGGQEIIVGVNAYVKR